MFLLYSLRAPIWVGGPQVLPVQAHSGYATETNPQSRGQELALTDCVTEAPGS